MGIKARLGVGGQRRGEKREQGKISQGMEIHGFPPRAILLPFSSLCRKGEGHEGNGREFWGRERFLNPDGSSGEEESGGGGGEADYQLSLLCFQPITNLGTFSPLMLSLLRSKLSLARMAAIASSLAPGCHPCPDPPF